VRFVLGVQDRGREKSEIAGRARNVQRARERDWFAGVDRFRAREFFQIALDQIGDAQKDLRSFLARCFGPVSECFLRRGDRKIDIFFSAIGDLRVRLAGRRLDVVQVLAGPWLAKLAVDKIQNLE